MVSLVHYNLFPNFSLREAAYLASGIDPRAIPRHTTADAVLEQMTRAVEATFDFLALMGEVHDRRRFRSEYLVPIAVDPDSPDHPPLVPIRKIAIANANALFRNGSSDLRFDRAEIQRWINENGRGFQSKYQFVLGEASSLPKVEAPNANGRWPWGSHETELLRQLEAAALRFWGETYDPDDDETAPTNEQVAEWLLPRVGNSRRIADAIATLLRKDGLRSGRRSS